MAHALFWLPKIHNQEILFQERNLKTLKWSNMILTNVLMGANRMCTWLTFA